MTVQEISELNPFIAATVGITLLAAVYSVEATKLPPIGQWISCDDPHYSIGGHGLCDFPSGPTGQNPTNSTSPASIILSLANGTMIDTTVFKNGTVVVN